MLVVSLWLVLWGGWSLISGFPNFDALQAVAAPLSTPETDIPTDTVRPTAAPAPVTRPTATRTVTEEDNEPGGDGEPAEADKTATAHAVQTMLSQPSGGGGTAPSC